MTLEADHVTPEPTDQLHAQVEPAPDAGSSTRADERDRPPPPALQEIVITAEYRTERLVDAPLSLSVLSTSALDSLGATQFRDWANTIPALAFTTSGAGYTFISLRGITTGLDPSPTVGIYVDDVPYGSSTPFAFGNELALDADLFDIARIEVLRGPQGTLYGASTMGGLIKYITKQPNTEAFTGETQAGVSTTDDGGLSYNAGVAVNAPIITGKAAVRLSAFYTHDGGFVDNIALNIPNANKSGTYGGRLNLLLTPIDGLTVRIGAFTQNISRDGQSTADYTLTGVPEYGTLDQYRLLREPFNQHFTLISGSLDYDFGPATLTTISSYQTVRSQTQVDGSGAYVPLFAFFGLTYGAVGFGYDLSTNRFTQEIRISSKTTTPFEWLVGGYYTRETSNQITSTVTLNSAGQPVANDIFYAPDPSLYFEYAGYIDITYHLTSAFDVTAGARYSRDAITYTTQNDAGLFAAPEPSRHSNQGVTTYLANLRYHFSENTMGYLRYATGYRPGGPNFVLKDPNTGLPEGPQVFRSDTLDSYEVGYKADTADHRYGVDADIYYIDWKDIQVTAVAAGLPVITNAPGGATSEGAELTFNLKPTAPLTASGALAYMHSYLREAEPDLSSKAGEELPNVPHFTATLSSDYRFSVVQLVPTIGVTVRYIDARTSHLSKPFYNLPPYTTLDVRTGLTLRNATLQVYVHNVFNSHGQLSAFTGYNNAQVSLTQPRTIGLTVTADF